MSRPSGLDALRRRLASLPGRAAAAVAPALAVVANDAADDARTALAADGGEGPSPPGDAPADPLGRLADTVAVTTGAAPGGPAATVTVSAPAALFLEYGTARMEARPFLRPAAFKAAARAKTALLAALRQEVKS